jgi:hypothetical protein
VCSAVLTSQAPSGHALSQMRAIDNLLAFIQSGATHRAPGLRPTP